MAKNDNLNIVWVFQKETFHVSGDVYIFHQNDLSKIKNKNSPAVIYELSPYMTTL